jgi:hypothetical protein
MMAVGPTPHNQAENRNLEERSSRERKLGYRVDGVVSETFPSHDAARRAAEHAAAEQRVPGNTTGISYEDKDGRWHDELSDGHDRPITEVKG